MKLTINRDKWLRGEPGESSLLRSRDGKMCCLGFYCLACGVSEDDITDISAPSDIRSMLDSQLWLFGSTTYAHSTDCRNLIFINDVRTIGLADRERKIKEVFARHDVEVEFV
jgi:hypothetical protein